jgi:hypothetical protein
MGREWELSFRLGMRPWIAVAYSAPVAKRQRFESKEKKTSRNSPISCFSSSSLAKNLRTQKKNIQHQRQWR